MAGHRKAKPHGKQRFDPRERKLNITIKLKDGDETILALKDWKLEDALNSMSDELQFKHDIDIKKVLKNKPTEFV